MPSMKPENIYARRQRAINAGREPEPWPEGMEALHKSRQEENAKRRAEAKQRRAGAPVQIAGRAPAPKREIKRVHSRHFAGKPASSYLDDCVWASENFALVDVKPENAPSARAWGLMLQVRENPQFLQNVLLKLASKEAEADDPAIDKDLRRTERELCEAVDRIELAQAG